MSSAGILQQLGAKLASVTTSRDPTKTFLQYKGVIPFWNSTFTHLEAFDLEPGLPRSTQVFGQQGVKEMEMLVRVVVSVFPGATDDLREQNAVQDTSRLQDALELTNWGAANGLFDCTCESAEMERVDAQRWFVNLDFRITYTEQTY